ncbi:MAG TPA: leucyl aminopeptidase [Vicinamibacterales bacterium]|nr:leucyl aminopeptidase [Vicinamibacterales bacterium]
MALSSTQVAVGVWTGPPPQADADLLIVPVLEDDSLDDLQGLDHACGGELARARTSGELRGRAFEIFVAPIVRDGCRIRRVAFVGAGRRNAWSTERIRRVAAAGGLAARQRRAGRVAFYARGVPEPAEWTQAIVEGLTLSEFNAGLYKTGEPDPPPPREWIVALPGADERTLRVAAERGRVLGECSNLARWLANEPGNILTPRVFADRIVELTTEVGLTADALDEHAIARLGMGLLLGVARGSAEPPRLAVIRHDPPGAPPAPVLGLVGKGITFDTGGISIKPAEGMDRMKDDMAGGAAVALAMRAIARLGAPIRVVGIVPATENMPGGRALKPGDVLRSASGRTVEVNNTDAEGRLILGDGLWYAQQLGATHLVDVATLTGACVVALGRVVSGLFGTPDAWVGHIREVARRAGDPCWPMPVLDEYAEQLRSEVADMVNSGGRPAGAITAAMFLKEFTGGLPWAHLDIAGTAWSEEAKPFQPKGPTGVAVRTLAELAFTQFPV